MMYDPLNTGIGSLQGNTSYLGGLTQNPSPGVTQREIIDPSGFSPFPSYPYDVLLP